MPGTNDHNTHPDFGIELDHALYSRSLYTDRFPLVPLFVPGNGLEENGEHGSEVSSLSSRVSHIEYQRPPSQQHVSPPDLGSTLNQAHAVKGLAANDVPSKGKLHLPPFDLNFTKSESRSTVTLLRKRSLHKVDLRVLGYQ